MLEKIVKLKIIEFERELSFINYIRLFAFDYPYQYKVAQLSNGTPVLWVPQEVLLPSAVINSTNHSVSGTIVWEDQIPYSGHKGDYLLITFDNFEKTYDLLVIKSDFKTIFSLRIYILYNNSWVLIDTIRPRALYSWFAVNLEPYLKSYNEKRLTIKIEFTANHKIDFLALTRKAPVSISLRKTKLIYAIHSRFGRCTSLLRKIDTKFVIIAPGDELYLVFKDKQLKDYLKRAYLLEVVGWYTTLPREMLKRFMRRVFYLDPTVGVSSPEICVNDSGVWVKVPVDLSVSRSDIQSVKFVVHITSPVKFTGYIDLATSYFEIRKYASSAYGDICLVALIERVDNVEGLDQVAIIRLALSIITRPISEKYGTYMIDVNIIKYDNEAVYVDETYSENVVIPDVREIIAFDDAVGKINVGLNYVKCQKKLDALISSLSLALTIIGIGLSTIGFFVEGTAGIILAAASYVIDLSSLIFYFIPNNAENSYARLSIWNLDTNASDDNKVKFEYNTWYYCYQNEGSAVTRVCILNVPIEWTCILPNGINKICINVNTWFGAINEHLSGSGKVLQIDPPYSTASLSLELIAMLLQ